MELTGNKITKISIFGITLLAILLVSFHDVKATEPPTVHLDKDVYTWTDKVFITITAPEHNTDSTLVDVIGDTAADKIQIATRGNKLTPYKLVETGVNTGIFTGEVILTGFIHDADGDGNEFDTPGASNPNPSGTGPKDGFLQATDDDGIIVSFEYEEDNTVKDSALIRWNVGQVTWLNTTYPPDGQGTCRIVDPDMDLDPNSVNNFRTFIWSNTDLAGVQVNMTETGQHTGIFDGIVYFTNSTSTVNRLHVVANESVTCEYNDRTLPVPYTTLDNLRLKASTKIIGPDKGVPPFPKIELNSKTYTWTDKVFVTITAPDYNLDSNFIEEIGGASTGKIQVATRGNNLIPYKLVETGLNTGIFTGEITLTGFANHDADGDGGVGDATGFKGGTGPTDGLLPAKGNDGISVSFQTTNQTVTVSSMIQWNVGKVSWSGSLFPLNGQAICRIVDPDLNTDLGSLDSFLVNVWSDTDTGGIALTVTETGESTGIFEGTVFFTNSTSTANMLRVNVEDKVICEYEDNTLPDPNTETSELEITAITHIEGTKAHMLDTTASFGLSVHSGRPVQAEFVTPTSQLIGDYIDTIVLKLKKFGTPAGTAIIGVFDSNLSVKKIIGTIDASAISNVYTDYTFTLPNSELSYQIQSDDRIGIKFTGGNSNNNIGVMTDNNVTDPFDGQNSYHTFYTTKWIKFLNNDLYMILREVDVSPILSFPVSHMEDTIPSFGLSTFSGRQINAEYVSDTSSLVGDQIDTMVLTLRKFGTPTGTAEIGIFNPDLSVKKLFGTVDVSTLTTVYKDYVFSIPTIQSYMIQSGDRIGVKFTGGSVSNNLSVMTDQNGAEPFDGINSYLAAYTTSWNTTPNAKDLTMILLQTAGGTTKNIVNIYSGTSTPGCEQNQDCYNPSKLVINQNSIVLWFNGDSAAHTVTSGNPTTGPDGIFDSSLFAPGKIFGYQFSTSGTFNYFCMVHPWMRGTVIVL